MDVGQNFRRPPVLPAAMWDFFRRPPLLPPKQGEESNGSRRLVETAMSPAVQFVLPFSIDVQSDDRQRMRRRISSCEGTDRHSLEGLA